MSHYETLFITLGTLVLLIPFIAAAFYHKGCQDTWRKADEMAQMEPIFPSPVVDPQPIVSPKWSGMVLTINCQECQDEQAL